MEAVIPAVARFLIKGPATLAKIFIDSASARSVTNTMNAMAMAGMPKMARPSRDWKEANAPPERVDLLEDDDACDDENV